MIANFTAFLSCLSDFIIALLTGSIIGYFFIVLIVLLTLEFFLNFLLRR